MKKTARGFTLVELIVVIVVLGILAAVAVPAYSGYVKKAREAADDQLLAAVNTAFGAACLENGVDMAQQPDYYAGVNLSEGKVAGVTKWNDAFLRYFTGNEDTAFNVFTALWFKDGVFAPATGETTVGTVTVSNAALANFMASTYNSKMKVSDLTGGIDALATQVLGSDTSILSNELYQSFLSSLGLDAENLSSEQTANALALYVAASADSMTAEDYMKALSGNATITGTTEEEIAKQTLAIGGMGYAMYLAYVNSGYAPNGTETTKNTVTASDTYNYANTDYETIDDYLNAVYGENNWKYEKVTKTVQKGRKKEDVITGYNVTATINPSEFFDSVSGKMAHMSDTNVLGAALSGTESWKNYLSQQGSADLNGFLAAMDMVNSNVKGNPELVNSVLSNGWENGGVDEIFNTVVSSGK